MLTLVLDYIAAQQEDLFVFKGENKAHEWLMFVPAYGSVTLALGVAVFGADRLC